MNSWKLRLTKTGRHRVTDAKEGREGENEGGRKGKIEYTDTYRDGEVRKERSDEMI